MDWQGYEQEIEEQFRTTYPAAQITRNAKVVGKFSKVERQIDILIDERVSDFAFRIVVDAKYRGRKLDVSDVEGFIGLTRDVEAHTGMMVALEGYTPAAVNRAHNDDLDIILDVLNLEELKSYQGHTAIPYSGEHGVWIAAPFGWIIDATRREGLLATLYQRGLTFEEAVSSSEWMYINFWHKQDNEAATLEALLELQRSYMLEGRPRGEITISEGSRNQRTGGRTLIRRFKRADDDPLLEYTGFVDFEHFIFMCVLLTPKSLERKDLRKLRFILRDAFPIRYKRDNSAVIRQAEAKLAELKPPERARMLAQIGWWYRDMNELPRARERLEASLSLVPGQYDTTKQLLATLIKMGDKGSALQAMGQLLRLDPHNPTVFNDCLMYARNSQITSHDLVALFDGLRQDYVGDDLVTASSDFYAGRALMGDDRAVARERFEAARTLFQKLFPEGHQALKTIDSALAKISTA